MKGSELIEAKPFENRHVLDRTPDYYERLQASYDEQFYRQEVLGEFVNTRSGQVYYGFQRKEHVGQFELQNDAPLLWTWDFNLHPMCSLICQQKDDAVYVLDEIVLDSSSTPEVCDEFLVRYGEHSAGLQVYGDATAKSRQTSSGLSDHHIIRDFITTNRRLKGKFMIRQFESGGAGPGEHRQRATTEVRAASGEYGDRREVQGVDPGPGAGLLQAGKLRSLTKTVIREGRTCRTRWVTCCGRSFGRCRVLVSRKHRLV